MTMRSLLRDDSGFTLIEMIVVVFLLAIAMLGILAVFDASARINKSEQQVADAQGSVRYGIYQMTRIVRMAGAGGLFVRQAILNVAPNNLAGINPANVNFDNVPAGTTVMDLTDAAHEVRTGTDMIEVRGVILSPLYGLFDVPCGTDAACNGSGDSLAIPATTDNTFIGGLHYNNDIPNRPQFDATYAYTNGVAPGNPMFVLVAGSEDQSFGCDPAPPPPPTPPAIPGLPRYPQATYNVALITIPAAGNENTLTFAGLNFTDARVEQLNGPDPAGGATAPVVVSPSRVGVLDDILFFIDNGVGGLNSSHPTLVQAIRRGDHFDVTTIADDVEDMQIAYGVDVNDDGVGDLSTMAGGDEWTPNVQTETAANPATFVLTGATCPQLHAVLISLLAKSRDPDPNYKGPSARGFMMMNVPLAAGIPTTMVTPGNYRRRVQTLRIALRNYGYTNP